MTRTKLKCHVFEHNTGLLEKKPKIATQYRLTFFGAKIMRNQTALKYRRSRVSNIKGYKRNNLKLKRAAFYLAWALMREPAGNSLKINKINNKQNEYQLKYHCKLAFDRNK